MEEMLRKLKSQNTQSHFLKVDNISLLKKYQVTEVESSFDLGGEKWKLIMSLNVPMDQVTLFLRDQDSKNVSECLFFVVKQPGSMKYLKKGPTALASLEGSGHLVGDCCVFCVQLLEVESDVSGTAESFSLIEKPLNPKVTWMMSKFSSFDSKKAHRSNEFVVGNRKWRIEVHPRGYSAGKDKSFSVYLAGVGFINDVPKKKTFAKFKLRVLDQVTQDNIEKEVSGWFGEEIIGCDDFMPLVELDKPYLVNDKLYVGVEFEVVSVTNYC